MKTAISIPDTIFEKAEQLAHHMGVSRSELYVTAITQYLEAHREQDITEQLDALYGEIDSTLDPTILELQCRSLPSSEW
jgi:metal-responsive CopG/Arc/MetJ family transcriptional regulator